MGAFDEATVSGKERESRAKAFVDQEFGDQISSLELVGARG